MTDRSAVFAERRVEFAVPAVVLLALAAAFLVWGQGHYRALGAAGGFGLVGLVLAWHALSPSRLVYDRAGLTVWTGRRKTMSLAWDDVERFFPEAGDAGEKPVWVGWTRRPRPPGGIIAPILDDSADAPGRLPSTFGVEPGKLARILNRRLEESRAGATP